MQIPGALSRLPRWVVFVVPALCFVLPFLLYNHGSFTSRIDSGNWLLDAIKGKPEEKPPPPPAVYKWPPTQSRFRPVHFNDVSNSSAVDLCSSFPSRMLDEIQPILKTGHATLRERMRAQFEGPAACLHNILIFSDLEEEFEGHFIYDVIADIPEEDEEGEPLPRWPRYSEKKVDQLAPYDTLQELARNHTLAFTDTSQLEGWKTDKFKFLAGVSRAWQMRPNRQWYVFFEDDTYIVWDNVFRLLEHYNPDVTWYFGSPSPGRKPSPSDPLMWFANGGPGYILSRAAVKKLVKDDFHWDVNTFAGTQLTVKWWTEEILTNCCGDSILGWALWNEKIPLKGLWPMFSPLKPHTTSFLDGYWCQPVISMHKPKAEDIAGIWKWESSHRRSDKPLTYSDLATTYFPFSTLTTLENWSNFGRTAYLAPKSSSNNPAYPSDPHSSFTSCQQACEALPKCLQYRHHLRKCHLDNALRYGEARDPEDETVDKHGKSKDEPWEGWKNDDLVFRSGWVNERVKRRLEEQKCEAVRWVTPSIERIF